MRKKDIFWGLLFILMAVLIIANQLGFMTGISMFEFVATVILGGIIIKSLKRINFWGILLPVAFICILFADEWNIEKFTPWPALLTACLLSLGLSLIFKRKNHWKYHIHHDNAFKNEVVNEIDSKEVNCSISFGESIKYIKSEDFQSASIKCSFGEAKVYFYDTLIPSGHADINIDVSFGDAILYIPKNWKVINEVHVFLGDFEERYRDRGGDLPVVTIRGNVSFGHAEIIYV